MTDKGLKELKDTLWHSADVLRASAHLAANKYGQPILGLIFLRYADILYKQHKEEIETEYNRLKGGRMEKSKKEISIEKCGFYLPECAYYDFINDAPDDANKAILNTLTNLYEASKPEIFEKNWSNDKFAPLVYLHGLFYHTIDDEKVARARQKMSQILDGSVTARQDFVNYVSEEPTQYMIKGTKAIDLSKVDVEQLRKEIKVAKYKAIEINDLKEYIEQALEKMLNRNCTRTKFSERFKRIIDSYNAGGTENEDYYEQLVKLLEELRQEDNRANTEGLTEEELEIYDLLIAGKKLTQGEEQKVKLSAKNLYKKLVDNRSSLLVVDWYKDEQPRAKLKYEVELSLNDDLPESYDKAAFDSKVSLLMNHFVDMAVQGYGWIGAA